MITKKDKKKMIIGIIGVVLLLILSISLYLVFRDQNKLNILEKQWLSDNANTMINIGIPNDVNNFGNTGEGVFFDFINDVEKDYEITLNEVTYQLGGYTSGLSFKVKNSSSKKDLVFYEDHYILVSKSFEVLPSKDYLNNKKIGVIAKNASYIDKYMTDVNEVYTQYNGRNELLAGLDAGEVDYVMVPLNEYIDTILSKSYEIVYHFGDIKVYYVLSLDGDSRLVSALRKYYNNWQDEIGIYYNKANLNTFTSALNISEKDKDILTRKVYKYGFIITNPYEINISGNYGGIVAVYLQKFSEFSNVEFQFIKYKNSKKFIDAIENRDIDLYFNYYNYNNEYSKVNSLLNINYSIITKSSNYETFNSLNSLIGKEVYVLKDSILSDVVKNIKNIKVKYYNNEKELIRLARKDVIIVLDSRIYDYYRNYKITTTVEKYRGKSTLTYNFKVNGDATFFNILNKYISTLDPNEIVGEGLYNHTKTIKSGTIISKIATYLLYVIIIGLILLYVAYRYTKKVKISKKIKKEDKLKYIDQLTSLKNRNYLNENIDDWDKNTIYPQTVIVIDLNNIKYINDTLGHAEGDKQIQAAANILIKYQLDNTDVIRTDGNEFLIYLVGYEEKQIANYIRKLYKELKKLPYEYGAALGHSMITDGLKLMDDAINEAVIDMRKKKENPGEE